MIDFDRTVKDSLHPSAFVLVPTDSMQWIMLIVSSLGCDRKCQIQSAYNTSTTTQLHIKIFVKNLTICLLYCYIGVYSAGVRLSWPPSVNIRNDVCIKAFMPPQSQDH